MQTEFQKLVTKLHKKHRWQMQEIAEELGVGQSTISNCFYRRQGNTGAKFVPELQEIIEELEGKPLVFTPPAPKSKVSIRENESLKQDGLWKCPKCGVLQKPHDINNPYCLDRSCNKKL